ncbi:general amidase-b [Pyrenophora seminiperda CCB06]|uniref:amidase n=1 Tax=Pyrenophora seminiperda CCB06 TaxID=1302712 RepID=A0A3M7M922_9PLEO|nr:general amidase-b [Pyrenophora seminiperda CCB06]
MYKCVAKQQAARNKIPKEWLLPASVTDALQFPLSEHPTDTLAIPRQSGVMSEKELEITERYTVTELLALLAKGELSALEVTLAFSKRAALAQQLLSCLTETYFEEAQERARFLDNERAQGRIVGPLHGLPVSLKDGFRVKGSASTIGFVSFLDHPMDTENSPLVDILLELGAVVYVKTNLPQTLMTADSHNNIFGRTLNPHNTALTAGGSSGGEGALVGFRGSPLGIGTDIAGSIRIPALCCGTYGFKPSTARVPDGGQASPSPAGLTFFNPSAGPLANDMAALNLLCEAVLSARPALYDSTALDVPWRKLPKAASKLRLGLVAEDPAFPLHPPVKRALMAAAHALEAQGHEIIPISADQAHVADALKLAFAYFMIDSEGMKHIEASGEAIVPSVIQSMDAFSAFQSTFLSDCASLTGIRLLTALNVKREFLQEAWRKLWLNHNLDAVISPGAQNTAIPHDTYGLPPYTLFLNVLDYPAVIVPFGRADKGLDGEEVRMVVGEGQNGPDYEPGRTHGAPTAVQVFTGRMRDEECLQVAGVVDECLRGSVLVGP